MKSLLINSISIFLLLFAVIGCKKKDTNNPGKEGNVTISINYTPSGSSSFVYSWGQTEVKLHKDGVLVATLYANPNNPNLDFGKYSYGNYRVDCNANMILIHVNTGSSSTQKISRSQTFMLDSKNKNVSVTMNY
ncbi:hypothetical protein [Fluviicola sp.]|jgi:hypothetical protein|uniref:hypothetical protein n=1 Tax=Fluviicola sp. TaxID=1917219 RepID=UPI00282D0335|nr:hypothetical protein [Fluviicola sp.]MDR0802641.1 hypothetical protein [Fluviicola sp.]